MLLENYLKKNNTNLQQLHIISGIPINTIRYLNNRELNKWNISYFDAIAKTVRKERIIVINELEQLYKAFKNNQINSSNFNGKYNLENRRYIGNKHKLLNWIYDLIDKNTKGQSFFDVFAGTGVVTQKMMNKFDSFIINDFLFSNNIIYKAFFRNQFIDKNKLYKLQDKFQTIVTNNIDDDYFSNNFGGKFFSIHDAKIIGEIRTIIQNNTNLNKQEYYILLASLLYSVDKIANTVGHYDAYRKNVQLENKFIFQLINPIDTQNKNIEIFREDANTLVRKVHADITFIDPPYNSRQYSRFYHLLETITKWDKPKLTGVAKKPPAENMSEYSRVNAPKIFEDLICNLSTNYIIVTYNNTYNSNSSSSKNKITHQQILDSLNKVGITKSFEIPFQYFNAGKTNLKNHKEYIFITKVTHNDK